MNIPRPLDSIEKVENFFVSVRRDATTGSSRMPVKAFRDKLHQVSDLAPAERAAIDRWLCSKIRG